MTDTAPHRTWRMKGTGWSFVCEANMWGCWMPCVLSMWKRPGKMRIFLSSCGSILCDNILRLELSWAWSAPSACPHRADILRAYLEAGGSLGTEDSRSQQCSDLVRESDLVVTDFHTWEGAGQSKQTVALVSKQHWSRWDTHIQKSLPNCYRGLNRCEGVS